jgi:hypothetical protein
MSEEVFRLDNPMLVGRDFRGSPRDRSLGFSSSQDAQQFVSANITRAHLAAAVRDFTEPVHVLTHHTIFVADNGA